MSARTTADHIETGLNVAAFGFWRAGENAIADFHHRQAILAHNSRIAAIRAGRARRNAAIIARAAAERAACVARSIEHMKILLR